MPSGLQSGDVNPGMILKRCVVMSLIPNFLSIAQSPAENVKVREAACRTLGRVAEQSDSDVVRALSRMTTDEILGLKAPMPEDMKELDAAMRAAALRDASP